MVEKRNAYRILVGKPEGRRPLGRPRRRWVDNIEMHLREIGWNGMDWIDLQLYYGYFYIKVYILNISLTPIFI
jgi:hypothetical protein